MQHRPVFRSHASSLHARAALAGMVAFGVALPNALFAETPSLRANTGAGQALTASQRKLVEDLLSVEQPYACCSEPLQACLEKQPVCPLAERLRRAIVRMAAHGASKAQIQTALANRKSTMRADLPTATVVTEAPFRAGAAKAPVSLTVYACPRNVACAKLIPDAYREITTGRLKDKAALVYRPFFPADDREALECGRGLYAAAYQGQFWPYLVHLCLERDRLTPATIRDWASSHGLDRCIFDQTCEQASTAAWLQASRKEGLANGVTSAPAVFINGRRVQGSVDLETLVDLAEEEYERVTTHEQPRVGDVAPVPNGHGGKRR